MELQILTSATATNSPPVGSLAGLPLRGNLGRGGQRHMPNSSGNDEVAVLVASTAGSGTMTVTVRLWGYSPATVQWHPLGVGTAAAPDVSRGVLNAGNAIGEVAADLLQHAELVSGLAHFSRVYAEIVAIGGTSTAVSVWLVRGL